MAKEIDVTNLSFIDLLSCGLGAVLLLLLLFAVSIRTTALRALESEAQAGAQNTPAELQSRGGMEIPPPEALIIELDWGAPTLYPLQLEVEPPAARALTEESPFSGTNDKRYAGFFLRSAVREEDAGGSLLFVLPQFRGLLERLTSGTYSLKGWKVIVKYPNVPSPAA